MNNEILHIKEDKNFIMTLFDKFYIDDDLKESLNNQNVHNPINPRTP